MTSSFLMRLSCVFKSSFVKAASLTSNPYPLIFACKFGRSCRIYSFEKRQLLHDVKKMPIELVPTTPNDVPARAVRMFHSADTMKSFFRRLSFSPDGQILVVPAGCIEGSQSVETISSTTYVFSRSNLSK